MQRHRSVPVTLALVLVAACHDATAPAKPAAIKIVAGEGQTGAAGEKLIASPRFVVNDDNGHPIGGVSVVISVSAGDGILVGAPKKTDAGATSVGSWSLGPRVGVNRLTITVAGLPPVTVTATGTVGAAARIVPLTTSTINGRVAEPVLSVLVARLTDAFDNGIASAPITVKLTGGGSAPSVMTTDADGAITIDGWVLGTTAGQYVLTLTSGAATFSFIANAAPGDPARMDVESGDQQRAFAGMPVGPAAVRVFDRYGNAVPGQSASVSVTSGDGSVASTVAKSEWDGLIALPAWTLGRTALPQTLHVAVGNVVADVSASVETDYAIDVRAFGPEMTSAQKALFTNAAARIRAIIIGDAPDVVATNLNAASTCGVFELPVLNETIDDLIVFASVQPIDGGGGILAQAGPCLFRNATSGGFSVLGVMMFDSADLESMTSRGILQDVITHEMLHVVGVGTVWGVKHLITDAGTPTVAYNGPRGRQGCVESGGIVLCNTSVPVENNGVPGTAEAHWKETTFQSELMTGYVNSGGMPLSAITVGSLADLGYDVNSFAADPFRIPSGGPSANTVPGFSEGWEKPLILPTVMPAPSGAGPLVKRP